MTTKGDLHAMLYGEGGVEDAIRGFVAGEKDPEGKPPPGPFVAKAWYTRTGFSSRDVIEEWPIDAKGFSADRFVQEMEQKITEVLGHSPECTLEVRFWQKNEGSTNNIKRVRTLVPAGSASGMPSVELLRGEVHQLRSMVREMHMATVTALNHSGTMTAEAFKSLAQVATARGTMSAAGDLGGPWGLVGLAALFVALPFVQRMLKLPPGSSIPATIERLQQVGAHMVTTAEQTAAKGDGNPPQIPAGAAGDNGAGNGAGQPAAVLPDLQERLQGALDLLQLAKEDDKVRALVAPVLKEHKLDLIALLGQGETDQPAADPPAPSDDA